MYIPLLNNSEKYTLVLMGRADFGLLGSYNKYKQTPFETFHVGGDGMTGSYTYATETIGLRGYDNGALTPYSDGRAYTRFSMELHFRSCCSLRLRYMVWLLSRAVMRGHRSKTSILSL